MKNVTIFSLAEELGVNASTVSRALNNSPKISEKRRREVKELAAKRGFKLREFAPRLTNICILLCTGTNNELVFSDFTGQVMNGVNRYCLEQELELSIFSSPREKLNKMDVVKELFRRSTDGLIILNANTDCSFISQLEKEKLPYCCLLSGNPDFPDNILTVNNKDLAERAADYLIQLGHRNIAFLHSAPHNPAQLDRLQGYRSALGNAGLPINEELTPIPPLNSGSSGIEFGFQATTDLLNKNPDITAIFCASTDLAEGVRSACHRMGIRIPEDISLIGCDNSQHAEYFCPPLTVIDIPNDRLGYTAATWIHQRLQRQGTDHPPVEPWMQGSLIVRETTAPPRKHPLGH
jgi:DNA-binding LacI/PurR family transcriptional regulator